MATIGVVLCYCCCLVVVCRVVVGEEMMTKVGTCVVLSCVVSTVVVGREMMRKVEEMWVVVLL